MTDDFFYLCSIKELLNDKIDLNVDEDHPLPWYPPVCDKNPAKLSPYDEVYRLLLSKTVF